MNYIKNKPCQTPQKKKAEKTQKQNSQPIHIDDYIGMALGYLNMTEEDFWQMRLKSFFLKLEYWQELQEKHTREHAELIRLQTWYLVNIQIQKSDKLKKPQDLWSYSWDEHEKNAPEGISKQKTEKILKNLIGKNNG